jgi:hypothetical protein
LVPSERATVPRSPAAALPEATGVPEVSSGGQTFAQAPEQLDWLPESAAHRYSARPEGPTRYVPWEPLAVLTATPLEDALEDALDDGLDPYGDAPAAVFLLLLGLLLPHPATITAAATAATLAPSLSLLRPAMTFLPRLGSL